MNSVPGREFRRSRHPAEAETAPEDVFVAWLLSRPAGADICAAALREVARLEAPAAGHPGARRLHALFRALVDAERAPAPVRQ
ncbi:MAG: hypothetical protein ACRECY_05465 [Phyllobacterium sp.]